MNNIKEKAIEALREVIDYEIGINVYDGKMIYDIEIEEKNIKFKFKPTSPYCPIAMKLALDIKEKLMEKNIFEKIEIEIIDHVMAKQINDILSSY